LISARPAPPPAPAPPPRPAEPTSELADEPLDDEPLDDEPLDDEPADQPAEEPGPELETLDGDDTRTAGPAIRWGAVTAAVWLAFFVLSRAWRRWPAYVLGAPVFGITLFVFFGALTEALPANY
jgi:hypothetical protein